MIVLCSRSILCFSQPRVCRNRVFVDFAGASSVNVLYPLWGQCCRGARGKANLLILEKGAMDNATPATTNNTRMEKRIALECGKRKPEEVTPRPFRGLKMPSNQNWSFCFDLRDESAVNRRNLWFDSSPCAFVVLQIRELILDNCYSTTVVGLTDEFLNLEVLSLIKVGLTNLKSFPNLPNLRRVSKILLSLPHDFCSTTLS